MARGKQTCKILKEIRRQIADANGIEFAMSECRFKGDCIGTCPKCEAEAHYLEEQLHARSLAGKAIVLAGISAAMILMSGCSGTSSSNQSDETLTGDSIIPIEQTEEVHSSEMESCASAINDTVLSEPKYLCGIKEGKIANITNEVVTQGEMPDGQPKNPDESGIYSSVEQQPQFPGGPAEILRFIGQHLKYPEKQLKEGVQGRVVVQFYVDTLGRVCEPKIVRGKDPALDREALRVVRLFPNFTPGMINGKKVNTYFTLPIIFEVPPD